ncbi:MAG: response regulator [Rhodoferax sp.]|nr:response regulator [Rhodoferax sp.]
MNLSDARVMVVEDDPLMRTFTVNLLKRLGIVHLQESTDGTAGLKAASAFRPDVVLTDIHMKPMDGLEFVKRLNSSAGNHARVIFMSADSSRETLSAALPLGVVAYIVKPPRLVDLKQKIEAALAGA